MASSSSRAWAYFRIIAGTLVGGTLGFYVKHRLEIRHKEKMMEKLVEYEEQQRKKKAMQEAPMTTFDDSGELLSDS